MERDQHPAEHPYSRNFGTKATTASDRPIGGPAGSKPKTKGQDDTTSIWLFRWCVSGAESFFLRFNCLIFFFTDAMTSLGTLQRCLSLGQTWHRIRWLPSRSLAPIWMPPPSTSCSEAGSGSSSQVQGGAPPSYKLVYNPNNYRYNPHKP